MRKKYQSEALMVCHQSAEYLYKTGVIDEAEMREYDEDCLVPEQASTPQSQHTQEPRSIPAFAGARE
jgi:DNA-binding transcriptional regulator YiaG